MQVGPGIVSSRMFARDERPVPNIVAIYERPRPKVRRDATHVLGGMFGWNSPEETARALGSEDLTVEESSVAIASTPNSATADPPLSGPPQRCVKRSTKRSKRRTVIPLAEMGASILSLSLQERMSRRQEGDEKEEREPVSAVVKPVVVSMDSTTTVPDSTVTVKKIKLAAPGDAPTTKKLRLTISTAPPDSTTSLSTPLLQLPLSPPDTSSNASKAPADERYAGSILSSTPRTAQLPMPNFELDLSNLGGLSLSTLDSESDSESSSESSSDSSSDSPDLSSSTSTRSASQDRAKGKEQNRAGAVANHSRTTTPSVGPTSTRDPSTPPPRRKRRTHPPGWVGWVQTEESPDHSRLIRLDDVPVILGRKTRSGKEFADPPPLRRRPVAQGGAAEKQQSKSAPNSDRTDRKSIGQRPQQETRRRGATQESVESKEDVKDRSESAEPSHDDSGAREPPAPTRANPMSGKVVAGSPANSRDTTSAAKRSRRSSGGPTNASQSRLSAAVTTTKISSASQSSPAHTPTVLKLTRSDAIITPTGARSNEPERKETSPVKDSPSKTSVLDKFLNLGDLPIRPLPVLNLSRRDINQASSEKTSRSGVKAVVQSHPKDATTTSVSRSALGTSNSSTLINGVKSALAGSNSSPDSTVKKTTLLVTGSSSKNVSTSVATDKARMAFSNATEKVHPTKSDSSRSNAAQLTSNSSGLTKMASSSSPNNSLKASSSGHKTTRPFPMMVPSRLEKSEADSKPLPFKLGKRRDSSPSLPSGHSSSSSQPRVKKRKLLLSSSDESEGPKFIVNPFDRRAKKLELTRKGVSGEAFQAEMKKWMHAKKVEWKEKERQKEKQNDRSSGNEVRTAIAEGKPVSELVRHRLAGGSTSSRIGESKLARKKVYNRDWGMDVAKVSVAGSGEKRTLSKTETEEKRELNLRDPRESNAGKIKRELDTGRDLTKIRRLAT
ncbi:unnamed protein product [Rhizoctonia solani]|uniref:Uncharacterized protein n=1 Tax=Rhizoctonia solani TaxID=456999 RepID=A0A8H3H6L1_9AGAM|nr:unnamed protein product [Rhizoctonia solani]